MLMSAPNDVLAEVNLITQSPSSTTEKLTYSKNLWDKYTEIINKLTVSKDNVKQLQAMLSSQREIEEKFGKTLHKAEIPQHKDLYELNDPMSKYVQFSQTYGLRHIEKAIVMKKEYLEELGAIRNELSQTIKRANKEEAKLRSDYKAAKEKVEKAKKKDHEDKTKFEQLQSTLFKSENLPPKKLQSLQKDTHSAEERATRSELDYENCVKSLETVHANFHSKLGILMDQLEQVDRKRIQSVKSLMVRYSVQQKELAEILAKEAQTMMDAFNSIDEEKEIQTFISDTHSGEFPQPVEPCMPYKVKVPDELNEARFSRNLSSSKTTPFTNGNVIMNSPVTTPATNTVSPVSSDRISTPATLTTPSSTASPMVVAAIKRVRALFDYTATSDEEISFQEGEMIDVFEVNEDGWWVGAVRGKQGFFPSNFVTEGAADTTSQAALEKNANSAVALYDYTAQDKAELNMNEGDRLIIVARNEDGWWLAKSERTGLQGLIPSNFVSQN